METIIKCPKCGAEIQIIQKTDWLNFTAYLYPVCDKCKWTTKEVFYNVDQIQEHIKNNY